MTFAAPRRAALLAWSFLSIAPGTAAAQSDIPSSDRAERVISARSPELESRLASHGVALGDRVFLRAFKDEDVLEGWVFNGTRYVHVADWEICAWSGELGPKLAEGDGQVPEGFYFVSPGRLNPNSSYHLSMNIGFPNAWDRAHDRTGSYLMIHGACGSSGCLSMTDERIESIYTLVHAALAAGQPYVRVHIFPFRLDDERLAAHADSEWLPFWRELQPGYAWFEEHGVPADVTVDAAGVYRFSPDEAYVGSPDAADGE